jgi:hypothetical protein
MPSPLSAKIELPAAFHEVIAEYKKAIASVKRELKEVEAEAKEVLKTRGAPDEALNRRADALREIHMGLQDKANEQIAQKQNAILGDEIEAHAMERDKNQLLQLRKYLQEKRKQANLQEDQRVEQQQMLQGTIQKIGLRSDMVGNIVGMIHRPAEAMEGLAGALKGVGLKQAGAAAGAVAADVSKLTSLVVGNPYAMIAVAAAGVAVKLGEMHNESIKAQGLASIAAAADFTRLTGGNPVNNVMDAGSAGRAIRVRDNQVDAQHRGMEEDPRGVGDLIANALGFHTAAQIDKGEMRRQTQTKLEEGRQKFGLSSGVGDVSEGMKKQIDVAVYREMISPSGLATLAGASAIDVVTDPFRLRPILKFLGIEAFKGEGDKVLPAMQAKATDEQKLKDLERREAQRKSEETAWNLGVRGALNRVMENEKRRWLRAVEQDRSARFNSWSLT